jgi:cysteine synthase A
MKNLFQNNFETIGNTPLVKLNKLGKNLKNNIYAKIESRNPAFSIKDRLAYGLIFDALESGKLKKGMSIIEPTSGNTGIALAMVGKKLGFNVILTMPETMSKERMALMKMLGAEIILTDGTLGMKGAIDKANELKKNNPEKYYIPGQFDNPANPKIHEATTGPEIFRDLNGKVDILVAGVGTGGTITGITRFLKKVLPNKLISVAVEPENSPVLQKTVNNEKIIVKPHKIQGIGAGFVPKIMDLNLIDKIISISDEEAIEFAKKLFLEEGIIAGISSGAAVAASLKLAKSKEFENKNIVVILPDTGERYLSTDLFK